MTDLNFAKLKKKIFLASELGSNLNISEQNASLT